MCDTPAAANLSNPPHPLDAFRNHYNRFETLVRQAVANPTNSTIVARLGDDLDEFLRLVIEVRTYFNFDCMALCSLNINTAHQFVQCC